MTKGNCSLKTIKLTQQAPNSLAPYFPINVLPPPSAPMRSPKACQWDLELAGLPHAGPPPLRPLSREHCRLDAAQLPNEGRPGHGWLGGQNTGPLLVQQSSATEKQMPSFSLLYRGGGKRKDCMNRKAWK